VKKKKHSQVVDGRGRRSARKGKGMVGGCLRKRDRGSYKSRGAAAKENGQTDYASRRAPFEVVGKRETEKGRIV